MKKNFLLLAITLIVLCVLFTGCSGINDPDTATDDSVFPCIKGTVTMENGVLQDNVVIGIFLDDDAGATPKDMLETDAEIGRLYLNDSGNDGVSFSIAPDATAVISSDGSYYINLPAAPADTNDLYWFTAWYDTDADGELDLVAETIGGNVWKPSEDGGLQYYGSGEYNRLSVVEDPDISFPGRDGYISWLYKQDDPSEEYKFKYYDVTDADTYSYIDMGETDNNNTGFNFTISATTDTTPSP